MTDLHDLLVDAAPPPPSFDPDHLRGRARRRRNRRFVLATALAISIVALAIGIGTTRSGTRRVEISTPESRPLTVEQVQLGADIGPGSVAVDDRTVWLGGCSGGGLANCRALVSLDATTFARHDYTVPGIADPGFAQIAVGDGAVFILSNDYKGQPYHLTRFDPVLESVVWSVAVPGTSVDGSPKARLAFGENAVWFSAGTHPVLAFSPATGAVVVSVPLPEPAETIGAVGFAFDGVGGVWLAGGNEGTTIMRIDAASKRATVVTSYGNGFTQSLAADGGIVWTTHRTDAQHLVEIDHRRGERVSVPDIPTGNIAAADGHLWFLDPSGPGRIGLIDENSGTVVARTTLNIADSTPTLLASGDRLWVVDVTTHSVFRVTAS